MKSLQDIYLLPRAGRYLNPRRTSDALPVVYGDLSAGPEGPGLWKAVCIDTQSYVYALAGTPLLAHELGNPVRIFDREGVELFDFQFDPAHDFQGQGAIATVTMSQDQRSKEPLSVSAQGRVGASGLLVNPVDILRDFLLNLAGLDPDQLDGASWAKARRQAQQQGYQAAGSIDREQSLGSTLSQILGCFLGSWWLDASGRLRIGLEGGSPLVLESEIAYSFAADDTLEASVSVDIKNICNRIACQYAYNWDGKDYEATDDGTALQDLMSRSLYDDQTRQLKLPWVRLPQVANRVQTVAVGRFGGGARLISLDIAGMPALHLEKGDYAWFSSSWLRRPNGRLLADQLVRVLSLATDLDKRSTSFILEDSGYCRSLAWLADGSGRADGSGMAGGEDV
jgi:hypothetical protein